MPSEDSDIVIEWDLSWTLSISSLLILYSLFLVSTVFSHHRLTEHTSLSVSHLGLSNRRLMAKKIFHRIAIFLFILRLVELSLLLSMGVTHTENEAFLIAGDILSTSSAILFVLLYGIVFLFWLFFYRSVRYGSVTDELAGETPQYIKIFSLIVGILAAVNIIVGIILSILGIYDAWINVTLLFLVFVMVFEGAAFLVVGILLYRILRESLSHLSSPLTSKAFQIALMAVTMTILFEVRGALIFLQVDITQIKEGGPDWSINMDWWYPILFFVTCELMPILIMMLFQARLPKRPSAAVPPYEFHGKVEDFSHNINTESASVSLPFSIVDTHSHSLSESYSLSHSLNSNEGSFYGAVWMEKGREKGGDEKGGDGASENA